MKNFFFTILVLITTACNAQTPIINIIDDNGSSITNAYYKDINNLLHPFEGTWLFTDGNKSLKIVLVKKTNRYNGKYYEDYLIGGYEYKVESTIIVSTLSDINVNYPTRWKYKINGNMTLKNDYTPRCPECNVDEYRLRLNFKEPASVLNGQLIIRKITVGGQEALKINLSGSNTTYYKYGTTPPPDDFVVPSGEYILIKQWQ